MNLPGASRIQVHSWTSGCLISILLLLLGTVLSGSTVLAEAYADKVVINEVLSSNSRSNYDNDFGAFSDWVELFNPTGNDINLKGWYLSDDPDEPDKWEIPANTMIPADGFLLFWADNRDLRPGQKTWVEFTQAEEITVSEYHMNFRINSDLEEILLYNAEKELVDRIVVRDQERDYSYGRNLAGSWRYLGEPTPLNENSSYSREEFVKAGIPVFSIQGGLYAGSLTIELTTPGPGAVVRYSTDGSEPNSGSLEYKEPISILFSQVIKARVFETDKLPGEVATESFIINNATSLPVLSISTGHHNLWGFDFGLYQRNLKNREVFSHLEYFNESGSKAFQINAGLQLFGSQIFLFDQKPFSIYFRNRYGQDSLNYNLFRNKDLHTFHSLVLRNGGNDNNLTMIRDGFGAALIEGEMDMDSQSYQPVVVYMNGEYWGIFNFREKLNEEYLAGNHGINPAYVDILEDSLRLNNGDANDYRGLLDFVTNNDLSLEKNYEYVAGKIDVSQFTNYMSYKIYGGYRQWQVNNKYWKERTRDSKWRWMAFDLEHCFAGPGGDNYDQNTFIRALEPGEDSNDWHTLLFRKLMGNKLFREAFIQRTALYLNTVFEESRVISVIDSLQSQIKDEMDLHIQRWEAPVSKAIWSQNMDRLRDYARQRNQYMFAHMKNYFSLADTSKLTIVCNEGGKIIVCGSKVLEPGINHYTFFNDVPVSLAALPKPGYLFTGWNGTDPDSHIELHFSNDTVIEALFEPSPLHLIPDTIRGTLILDDTLKAYLSTGNVHIPAGDSLIIGEGVKIWMMPRASLINNGYFRISGNEARPVTIDVNPNIVDDYPGPDKKKWGAIITVSTDSAIIRHLILKNASSGEGMGNFKGAISAINSNLALSFVQISDVQNPIWCESSIVRINSCVLSSNGTGDLINLKNCQNPIITHNNLKGNFYEDCDGIDLDSVWGALVEHNKIFSFFGSNSDGIDLGEQCKEIVIRHNTLLGCSDKGISVGQGSQVEVRQNLVVDCGQGIGIKDSGSYAWINQNTLYGNRIGIACFEKNLGRGGGEGQVENTIIASSGEQAILVDSLSTLTVSYSVSDTDSLWGYNNLKVNPRFAVASNLDFYLLEDSPCVDRGTPNQQDPDGTRADIGAFIVNRIWPENALLINEINYNPHAALYAGDWIELFNASDEAVNLSGWILKGEKEEDEFVFPDHLVLDAGAFLVVAENRDLMESLHSSVSGLTGNLPFGLSSEGESLRLYTDNYSLVHTLRYSPEALWPDGPNGKGATLELYDKETDNSQPANWHASHILGGTPGQMNSRRFPVTGLYINEFMAKNETAVSDGFGEFDDWVEIYNGNDSAVDLGGIYFMLGNHDPKLSMIPLYRKDSTSIGAGSYKLFWADKDPEQGILHTDFNIPSSGGSIGLAQVIDKDIYPINQIAFGLQNADLAFGRYPDGADLTVELLLSPGSSNRLVNSVESPVKRGDLRVYPNPASTHLFIVYQPIHAATGKLMDSSGRSVMQFELAPGGSSQLDVSNISPGIYILKLEGATPGSAKIVIH
ncbi:MAG: T9SS type A sorting domain-containing protein [Bacteroidetes bacterium]|nr:T9SS type A sorting domain-containing protein [Bacteroidota bacterium]